MTDPHLFPVYGLLIGCLLALAFLVPKVLGNNNADTISACTAAQLVTDDRLKDQVTTDAGKLVIAVIERLTRSECTALICFSYGEEHHLGARDTTVHIVFTAKNKEVVCIIKGQNKDGDDVRVVASESYRSPEEINALRQLLYRNHDRLMARQKDATERQIQDNLRRSILALKKELGE